MFAFQKCQTKTIVGPTFFWTQYFCSPQNNLNLKFVGTYIFLGHAFVKDHIFFWLTIVWNPNGFRHFSDKHFWNPQTLDHKFVWPKITLNPNVSGPNFFGPNKFVEPKYCWTKKCLGKKIVNFLIIFAYFSFGTKIF